mgnify:CR=1 FL=1
MGTSRNTGSDKQTYYKLTTSGSFRDSVHDMAAALMAGGAMDGDLALAEAAGSLRAFFHLVDIGVPFPTSAYGEYVGYQTDHDPARRGTSAGPLTSHYMTQRLEEEARALGVTFYDGFQVVELLVDQGRVRGLVAVALRGADRGRLAVFSAQNVVYATGGEAGLYEASVYPPSQTGGSGPAFRAGALGKNLTEWQYGIASTRFRWNLSGTFQQVLPRYISTDADGGDEREFLDPWFETPAQLLTAIFLKGYQWPFDPRKVMGHGSSLVDVLVYQETMLRGRRVWLDFRRNPSCLECGGLELLEGEGADWTIRVRCSKGTYVRTLCHDLGRALGCGACMSSLRRTRAGSFTLAQAVTMQQVLDFAAGQDPQQLLMPVDAVFAAHPPLIVTLGQAAKLKNGAQVKDWQFQPGTYRVYAEDGEFLLLGRVEGGVLTTIKSFFEVNTLGT